MKNKKNYLVFLITSLLVLFFFSKLYASESRKFLSLKNNEVNLRQGPSFKYPIKLIYKKKYLPVLILDTSETWRKIKDFNNNYGWIHVSQLSKKKSSLNFNNKSILYKNKKFPNSSYIARYGIYLPSYFHLKKKDIDYISSVINKILK